MFEYQGTSRLDPLIGQLRGAAKEVKLAVRTVSKANTTELVPPG